MGSSPQAHDLGLLSPVISAYSAVRYVPNSQLQSTVSRLISDYQPLDQHLSTTLSAPFSHFIDHYIYYCEQESLRRNGVAIIDNKSLKCSTWVKSQK